MPRYPTIVEDALTDRLLFRPAPPGDEDTQGKGRLAMPKTKIPVDALADETQGIKAGLETGALTRKEVEAALKFAHVSKQLSTDLLKNVKTQHNRSWDGNLAVLHQLDKMAVAAIGIIDRAQTSLLKIDPLTEVHFRFTDAAKAVLALGWEAVAKRGAFPLPPMGLKRFEELRKKPCGAMHFVSASDIDAGYFYTMGIAQSPEAQALDKMDLTYGLDGELIVPGQAVSPIPPFLAIGTRLFAASIPTSSNISEEVQSIPMRNFPHPTSVDDLEPRRGGMLKPPIRPKNIEEAVTDLRIQLDRHEKDLERKRKDQELITKVSTIAEEAMPDVGAVFEVTGMTERVILKWMKEILAHADLRNKKKQMALYLNIEPTQSDRVTAINLVVDTAHKLGLKYVAVADDVEDAWLPNLLEYLEPDELNEVADYSDKLGIVVIDGRPVDPVYTAATAAQRIQSVFTTLSVDILKMGMWLCLDALNARQVWREIISNPHIPEQMLLMPIGIVEPWSAFVDNRRVDRTPRAILDPFGKIKFMIEEAAFLGVPSLLTDTRHKSTWVLLGQKTDKDEAHLREKFVVNEATGKKIGRTRDSAIPLLSWDEFMKCEKLARQRGIILGQAGSIEVGQAFKIIAETTYDAAKDKCNPATAIWTAETERVLRTRGGKVAGDLHTQRSSSVSPFLAVVNRGYESHAKLEGWLRYLEEVNRKKRALRTELEARRQKLVVLIEQVVTAQRAIQAENRIENYQKHWDAFRDEYLAYHRLIKENYVPIRDEVASLWRSSKRKMAT